MKVNESSGKFAENMVEYGWQPHYNISLRSAAMIEERIGVLPMNEPEANGYYRGKRALMLLRVSTAVQEEMYGWPSQERAIRAKLIEPLGLRLDEERHVIRDTYTGLEFRDRPALERILEIAQRGEVDLLVMDVLDRLGRRGLAREIYRLQLRELGVRILSTDPDDHADDDTSWGELIRYLKGKQAEDEIKNMIRRTMGGKRAKAEGRTRDGTIGEQKVVGYGPRLYGYNFVPDENGKTKGIEPNHAVILVDETGETWTEVKVVRFIFESAREVSIRKIAELLNGKQIPPPTVTKGVRVRRWTGEPLWQPSVVREVLHRSAYWGEYPQFRTLTSERTHGQKFKPRLLAPPEHQVIIPVPAIVAKEFAETVHKLLLSRQKKASRNNRNPNESLLRAGLIKCGQCGGNMTAARRLQQETDYILYMCGKRNTIGRCPGARIPARRVDEAAWQKAVAIIRDPSEVAEKVRHLTAGDPTEDQRKNTLKVLADIRRQKARFRSNLSRLMQEETVDRETARFLNGQLNLLEQQEQDARKQLASEQAQQDKYNLLRKRLAEFLKRCNEWREKLDTPEFTPTYQFMRDACEFFGITGVVYKLEHDPRFEIQVRLPSIVSLIS
jgi:site-specific DNA recombinase